MMNKKYILLLVGIIFVIGMVWFNGPIQKYLPVKNSVEECLDKGIDVHGIMKKDFGLNETDYKFSPLECSYNYPKTFIKAKGIYRNDTPFELNFHDSACSSGGSHCGWNLYFKSSGTLFENINKKFCNRLGSFKRKFEEARTNPSIIYNNTKQIRKRCLEGKFVRNTKDGKVLALKQISYITHETVKESNLTYNK